MKVSGERKELKIWSTRVIVVWLFADVVTSAVYVFCELSRKNPKNYIELAPALFKRLTSSTNNWLSIKIVKLVG